MSYLERLKAEFSEKQPVSAPTKLAEAPFVTSVSTEGDAFSEEKQIQPAPDALDDKLRSFMQNEQGDVLTKPAKESPYAYPAKPAQKGGPECNGCAHLLMNCERHEGTRRIWFWRCAKNHGILEMGHRGERVLIAPPECGDWVQWKTSA